MKNLTLILFLLFAHEAFAQQKVDAMPGKLQYFAADSVVTDLVKNTIRLHGKAVFKYGAVHFVADEIIINRNTQQVIATGVIALSVPMVMGNINSSHKTLKYKMGENAVFMQ